MYSHSKLNGYAQTFIDCKVYQLWGRYGLSEDDLDDVRSELTLDLLKRIEKYDSTKATMSTFIQRVVSHKISNILREYSSKKMITDRQSLSLQQAVYSDNPTGHDRRLEDDITSEYYEFHHCGRTRNELEQAELIDDIQHIVDKLPGPLHQACLYLMEGKSISESASLMGLKRSTFYQQIMRPLREVFNAADLDMYVCK